MLWGQKFTRNRSISYGFRDIDTFSFSAKIQDGRRKWRKLKFSPFAQDTPVPPCGGPPRPADQKFTQNHSISYGFRDINTFSFPQKSKMGAESGEKKCQYLENRKR